MFHTNGRCQRKPRLMAACSSSVPNASKCVLPYFRASDLNANVEKVCLVGFLRPINTVFMRIYNPVYFAFSSILLEELWKINQRAHSENNCLGFLEYKIFKFNEALTHPELNKCTIFNPLYSSKIFTST